MGKDEGGKGMKIQQSDRQAAADLLGGAAPDGLLDGGKDHMSLVRAMSAHRQKARDEALEEAAKEADSWVAGDFDESSVVTAMHIAADIRDLKHG